MKLYIAQDNAGNIFLSDDKDMMPADATHFYECWMPELSSHIANDPTLTIEIQDYNEIVSLKRGDSVA